MFRWALHKKVSFRLNLNNWISEILSIVLIIRTFMHTWPLVMCIPLWKTLFSISVHQAFTSHYFESLVTLRWPYKTLCISNGFAQENLWTSLQQSESQGSTFRVTLRHYDNKGNLLTLLLVLSSSLHCSTGEQWIRFRN